MNILRMLQLTGNIYVPSFYEFVAEEKNKATVEEVVDVSLTEWAEIPMEWKGSLNGQNHFLSFKKGSIVLIPANIEQPVTEEAEGGEPKSTELKDVVDAPVQNSEDAKVKAAQAILDKVTAGSRFTDTSQTGTDSNTASPEPKTELGAEKVKESAEEKAKKIIAAVNASKRLTDTKETGTDSNTASPEPKTELGAETVKEEKLTEGAEAFDVFLNGKKIDTVWFTGYTAKEAYTSLVNHDGYDPGITVRKEKKSLATESAQVAAKVIKAVAAHSPPHTADGGNNATTEKATSTDYNKDIDPQNMVDAARDNVDNQKDYDFRTGISYAEDSKVEVPAKVISQIDQRISELESSITLYDNKGYNDQSMKQNAIDVLKQIKTQLEMKNLEGLQQAIVLYGTLMSPITGLMPAFLPNYLATATDTEQDVAHKPEA